MLSWLIKSAVPKHLINTKDIYTALLDKKRYKAVFEKLRSRTRVDLYRLYSYTNYSEMSLIWILSNERLVCNWIIKQIKQKSYSVAPSREAPAFIAKKERLLYRLEWPDRILQTVLAQILAEYWESIFPDCLFSFRKGKNIWQAIEVVTKYVKSHSSEPLFVLQRDVKSYGDSIPHAPLLRCIKENLQGVDNFVLNLIRQFIQYEYVSSEAEFRKKTIGLPTGMPLNCVLENLYLLSLDKAVSSIPTRRFSLITGSPPCIPHNVPLPTAFLLH